jgi:hypothetical protein
MYLLLCEILFYSVALIIKKVPGVEKKMTAVEVAQICDIMSHKHRGWLLRLLTMDILFMNITSWVPGFNAP